MNAALAKFITAGDAASKAESLRGTFIAHLTALTDEYNDTINRRMHYIRTGEVLVNWANEAYRNRYKPCFEPTATLPV